MEAPHIDKLQSLGLVWILKISMDHRGQEGEVEVEEGEEAGVATMNE